ncbi:hypothetical protein Tco_0074018 [Tanacetum coccineum]
MAEKGIVSDDIVSPPINNNNNNSWIYHGIVENKDDQGGGSLTEEYDTCTCNDRDLFLYGNAKEVIYVVIWKGTEELFSASKNALLWTLASGTHRSAKELWDSLKAKYMADDASSKKFFEIDKLKSNNIVGSSVVNMMEQNNSIRYNDNKSKRKHHDNTKLILARSQS